MFFYSLVYPSLSPGVLTRLFCRGVCAYLLFLVHPEFIPESPPLTRSRGMLAHLPFCRGPGATFSPPAIRQILRAYPDSFLGPVGPDKLACPVRVPYTLRASIINQKGDFPMATEDTIKTGIPTTSGFRNFAFCTLTFAFSTRPPHKPPILPNLTAYKALHLSRTLYKSALLCKTNPILFAVGGLQMNVSIFSAKAYEKFIPLAGHKNKPNSNPIRQACVVC